MFSAQKLVPFSCSSCAANFNLNRNLLRHESQFHGREKNGFNCILCSHKVVNNISYRDHLFNSHEIRIERNNITLDGKNGELEIVL